MVKKYWFNSLGWPISIEGWLLMIISILLILPVAKIWKWNLVLIKPNLINILGFLVSMIVIFIISTRIARSKMKFK